ncbi:bifunctional 2-polyprenyl-6-hydroxyphenol methylase/3-demethylubiquinol 3-O-methyltransferase UbiG [Paenibacillus thiaminolyticus]|uniref:Class I SAM-dependent methyltransferase n=1 Tax=Paenibacillus thiaminolyticus TaxID=49283 RepID=A0A3A3GP84_PANTH|nr:class I SAM-dependent methyltransferase [Paenibacillus thiaminolyticus]RJG24824.1 class I SAM-dependent methyltransferase [Paenibacillus thiaminolyticus]
MNITDKLNQESASEEIKKNVMLYPSERVVSFLARNFGDLEKNKEKNALDIGFGSGRHLKTMLEYGFCTYGIDYSKECFEIAKRNLADFPNLIKLTYSEWSESMFDVKMDAVVCFGVVFLKTKARMLEDLKQMYNIMNHNGKMLINFRNKENWFYGLGKEVEGDSFLLDERAGSYHNFLYTFLDLEDAQEMLKEAGFIVESIEREDYYKNNLKEKHSWWNFTVRKD